MTSLQIRYFLKVAECMSFSRAAQELYVSQPSVSRQIRLLEEELGCSLFDRTQKNRIGLTAAGIIYEECFHGMTLSFEQARAAAQKVAGSRSFRLRVGVAAGWDISEELLKTRDEILRRYPHAELNFSYHSFRTLRERLRSNELDVMLCIKTSILDFRGLEVYQLANLEGRAYVRRGLLRPDGEPLCIEDFTDKTLFMLRDEESPMAMEFVQIQFQTHQVKVNPVWLSNRETILQEVLMGNGFTVFDQYMRFRNDPRLTYYRMDDLMPICAVWNRTAQNPLIQMFAETLAEVFPEK